jgi:triosephosphate isomerase
LTDLGLKWAILGHSERRNLVEIKESDELIAEKATLAISKGVSVVYCIGELLQERESNQTFPVLEKQLSALLARLPIAGWASIVLAYEPVWAIGTGTNIRMHTQGKLHHLNKPKRSMPSSDNTLVRKLGLKWPIMFELSTEVI